MSAQAIAKLQALWQHLEFFVVDRTVARQPEDVLAIHLQKPTGHHWPNGEPMYSGVEQDTEEQRGWKRLSDVPVGDRDRAQIMWQRFHGFTTDGIRFDMDSYNELNFDGNIDPLLSFATGSTFIGDLPAAGQLICGIVEDTTNGRRLSRWFVCDEAFKLLVSIIRDGSEHSEEELGRLLLTDGFPDTYWALARLVCFDNVQAFVDCIRIGRAGPTVAQLFMGEPPTISSTRPDFGRHPAFGKPYGRHQLVVDWRGMFIGIGFARFVHELSHILEPRWWEDFLQLTAQQGVIHSHPGEGWICHACMAAAPDWERRYEFPYRIGTES